MTRHGWTALVALLPLLARAEIPLAERVSGYAELHPETRAMQDDDTTNPGLLWVLEGEALWNRVPGGPAKSCAGCHGDAPQSMRGVAARYPAYDAAAGRVLDLEQRINQCRTTKQQLSPWPWESRELLAASAFVTRQSRGLPLEVSGDAATTAAIEAGRGEFQRRRGQLNLSCAQCHDERHGRHLGGSRIPQAHPTGYPIYRLEWQSLGSLQRRLRGCMAGVRSEPYEFGAQELVNLELYLHWRARGMAQEAPGVRP